jgi:WbqC-like protein family.
VNIAFIQFFNQALGINTEIRFAEEFNQEGDRFARLVNICRQLDASCYVSGPSARNYLNEDLFTQNDIDVCWFQYNAYPQYKQLGSGFDHWVSILGLLLNEEPQAKKYMRPMK